MMASLVKPALAPHRGHRSARMLPPVLEGGPMWACSKRSRGASLGALLLASVAPAQDLRLAEQSRDEYDFDYRNAAVGDLDGDGLVDLVFSVRPDDLDFSRQRIVIQRQLAGGAFLVHEVQPALSPHGLSLADLDGDGDLDVAVAQLHDEAGPLAVYVNQGGMQGGAPGRLRRTEPALPPMRGVVDVLAVDADAIPATPDDLFLMRSGFPPVLLRNEGELVFSTWQSFELEAGSAAAVIDANGDARDDLFIARPCFIATQRGIAAEPPYSIAPVAACNALPFPETQAVSVVSELRGEQPWRLDIGIGTEHAGFWLTQTADGPNFALAGQFGSGALALIDADGDGTRDLVTAGVDTADGLSPARVHRRVANGFAGAALQSLPGAPLAVVVPGPVERLLLARSDSVASFYQSAPPSQATPMLRFDPRPHVFVAGAVPRPLELSLPAAVEVVALLRVTDPHLFEEETSPRIRAGHLRLAEPLYFDGLERVGAWRLRLEAVFPSSAAILQPPLTKIVETVPREIDDGCFLNGLFRLATFAGSARDVDADLTLLRRLRDERLAASPGGAHYIGLYQSLQPALWRASFRSPLFASELLQLKEAWMPAVASLVDGDGSAPISAAMLTQLEAVLSRYQVYAEEPLRAAIVHERRALDLDSLVGRPVLELEQRWAGSPLFRDGFD